MHRHSRTSITRYSSGVLVLSDIHIKKNFLLLPPLIPEFSSRMGEFHSIRSYALRITSTKFFALFQFATTFDVVLMVVGSFLAILTGFAFPVAIYLFELYVHEVANVSFKVKLEIERMHHMNHFRYLPIATILLSCSSVSSYACFFYTFSRQTRKLRLMYFESLLRKDLTWYDSLVNRDLPRRMISDIGIIQEQLARNIPFLFMAAVSTAVMVVASFWLSWAISVVAYSSAAVVTCFMIAKTMSNLKFYTYEYNLYSAADEIAADVLSKVRAIKFLHVEKEELVRYQDSFAKPIHFTKILLANAIFAALQWVIIVLYNLIITIFGVLLCNDRDSHCYTDAFGFITHASTQQIWAIILFASTVSLHAYFIVVRVEGIKRAQHLAAEILFTIKWKSSIDSFSTNGFVPVYHAAGNIYFKKVSFAFPTDTRNTILRNISFNIYNGQMVTIFGAKGSGKSSLLKLILRLYDPTSGKITLDGRNLRHYNVPWLRSQFAVIPSSMTAFDGTVFENLTLANRRATMEEVKEVCVSLDFHLEILSMPQGYNTLIGPRSAFKLNTRQLAKLMFAQALIKKSNILVLDDFISALAEELEAVVLQKLLELQGHCTVILTTERFSSIVKSSDIVLVMRKGKVVQQGNHYTMIKSNGWYSKLLEESLEYKQALRPVFPSQIYNFNFARLITRMHENTLGITNSTSELREKGLEQYSDSIFLRHDTSKKYRDILPRISGGLTAYSVVPMLYAVVSFKRYIRSELLKKRDLLRKLQELEVYNIVASGGDQEDEERKQTEVTIGRKEQPGFSSQRQIAHALPRESTTFYMAPRETTRASLLSGNTMKESFVLSPPVVKPRVRAAYSAAMVGKRLQRYCGWIMNSIYDNNLVTRTQSSEFWAAYNTRLMQAHYKSSPAASYWKEFLLCSRFCWHYMLAAILLSIILALLVVTFLAECIDLAVEIIPHNLFDRQVELFLKRRTLMMSLWAGIVVVAFIQELLLGFGFFHGMGEMRSYLMQYFLSRPVEWYHSYESDIYFLCESLYVDAASVQNGLFSLAVTGTDCIAITVYVAYTLINPAHSYPEKLLWWVSVLLMAAVRFGQGYYISHHEAITHSEMKEVIPVIRDILYNIDTIQFMGISRNIYDAFILFWSQHQSRSREIQMILMKSLCFGLSGYMFYVTFSLSYLAVRKYYNISNPGIWSETLRYAFIIFYLFTPVGLALSTLPQKETRECAFHLHNAKLEIEKKLTTLYVSYPIENFGICPTFHVRKLCYSFDYTNPDAVLQDVTFSVPPLSYYGITGIAGAGRNTLMNVLTGLYRPASGEVCVNEMDITKLEPKICRKLIGYEEQDPTFWDNMTVWENIVYGTGENLQYEYEVRQKVIKALATAMLTSKIDSLSNGYDTKLRDLPENAETFLFRQLLSIARLAFRDPRIVLINELTVSVDETSESILCTALQNLREGRTMIVSSRRIEPIRNASCIIVLDGGKVVEMGTDAQLMSNKGIYYELLMAQRLYEASSQKTLYS